MYSKFHPLESCFVFWSSFFETREVRLFFKGSFRAIPPCSLLVLFFVFITRVSRSREFIAVMWREAKPRTPCFVSKMIHMLPRELVRQKRSGGVGGRAAPPHLHSSDVARANWPFQTASLSVLGELVCFARLRVKTTLGGASSSIFAFSCSMR